MAKANPDVNCYIDESGDEGIGTGGSRWFILGGLIVPAANDLQVSSMVPRIKQALGKAPTDTLHWTKLKKHDHKLAVCRELHTEDYAFLAVATDKNHPSVLGAQGLKQKYALYHYSARLLLERLSWWTRDHGFTRALPIFEKRSNTSYAQMKQYFSYLRMTPGVQVSWSHIEYKNFEIREKGKSRLLQASDSLIGALREGLEYTPHGFVEPRYIQSLRCKFYRRSGNLFSYGLKMMHATPAIRTALMAEYEWLKSI